MSFFLKENFETIFEKKELNLLIRSKYYSERVLLFGDAIHSVHPLAGQGTNMTLRDLNVLTEILKNKINLGLDIGSDDVLSEFDYPEIYAPLDLGIGKCRLCIAQSADLGEDLDLSKLSHVRIATKYPETTSKYFAAQGIQAECVKLNGAMELAPKLGLTPRIVDLVSTGKTLKENGLIEVATIADVSSRLVVNRTALKVRSVEINSWIEKFRSAVDASMA